MALIWSIISIKGDSIGEFLYSISEILGSIGEYSGSISELLRLRKNPAVTERILIINERIYIACAPPSTTTTSPVTKSDAGAARNKATPLRSFSEPNFLRGVPSRIASPP